MWGRARVTSHNGRGSALRGSSCCAAESRRPVGYSIGCRCTPTAPASNCFVNVPHCKGVVPWWGAAWASPLVHIHSRQSFSCRTTRAPMGVWTHTAGAVWAHGAVARSKRVEAHGCRGTPLVDLALPAPAQSTGPHWAHQRVQQAAAAPALRQLAQESTELKRPRRHVGRIVHNCTESLLVTLTHYCRMHFLVYCSRTAVKMTAIHQSTNWLLISYRARFTRTSSCLLCSMLCTAHSSLPGFPQS